MHLWNSSRSSCFGTTTNVVAMTKWPMTSRCWNDSSLLTSMLQQTVDTASDFHLWNCLYYFKPYLFFPQSLCATGNVFGKLWQQSYVGPVILVTKGRWLYSRSPLRASTFHCKTFSLLPITSHSCVISTTGKPNTQSRRPSIVVRHPNGHSANPYLTLEPLHFSWVSGQRELPISTCLVPRLRDTCTPEPTALAQVRSTLPSGRSGFSPAYNLIARLSTSILSVLLLLLRLKPSPQTLIIMQLCTVSPDTYSISLFDWSFESFPFFTR